MTVDFVINGALVLTLISKAEISFIIISILAKRDSIVSVWTLQENKQKKNVFLWFKKKKHKRKFNIYLIGVEVVSQFRLAS